MVCLKGIPRNLSPDLLHVLALMGHGDEIVLADTNFPSVSICRHGPKEVRADGQGIPDLLRSVLQLMPLDKYISEPVLLMDLEPVDKERQLPTPVWNEYRTIVDKAGEDFPVKIGKLPRGEFYERAKKAFAVVHTGETALYGNIILSKGVIP